MLHVVKSWPSFFIASKNEDRTHELRRNDRNYRIGDELLLQKYDPKTEQYIGAQLYVRVTSITSTQNPCAVSDKGLHKNFVILSIKK